ncbi:unnamed protein product [Eruca vesicaria subsp. sativa]|uniref:Thaumatin-like protein n=1 Tax=Eruca vesicaria subsp. sativa TaxID=29727 RepID=A0ABC8K5I2_ERUVS|nr:unnamed protein product [Eruca vesicaria subsp. sativa]
MAERLPLIMFFLVSHLFILGVTSRNITIVNKCEFTVWPGIQTTSADYPFNISGFVLKNGESREINPPSTWKGRIWGRSRCLTNTTGSFSCQTGDCNSGEIECLGNAGTPSLTLAKFNFNNSHGMNNNDSYEVSVIQGYNLPMLISPQNELTCSSIDCMAINACTKFNLPQICCGSNDSPNNNYASAEKCQVTVDPRSDYLNEECRRNALNYVDKANPFEMHKLRWLSYHFLPLKYNQQQQGGRVGSVSLSSIK